MMSKRGSSESECGESKKTKRYGLTGLKTRPDDGASVVLRPCGIEVSASEEASLE